MTTLFHNNSLLNEPGIKKTHRDYASYHQIIQYRNYEYALTETLYNIYKCYSQADKDAFYTFIFNKIIKNKDNIIHNIKKLIKSQKNNKTKCTGIYSMTCHIQYKNILDEIQKVFLLLENEKNTKT